MWLLKVKIELNRPPQSSQGNFLSRFVPQVLEVEVLRQFLAETTAASELLHSLSIDERFNGIIEEQILPNLSEGVEAARG